MEDDTELVLRAQAGDSEAFGVLFDAYYDKIFRFVYYKVYQKEVAEDIAGDVFHKALTKIGSYSAEKGTFSAWLYRIARNAVIDQYRTKTSTVPLEDIFDIGYDERTPEVLDALSDLKRVSVYLETLTAKQREIIVLRIWEGLSYREIAEIVGGTEDGVKMAFSRSIRELRVSCGPLSIVLLYLASLPFYQLS